MRVTDSRALAALLITALLAGCADTTTVTLTETSPLDAITPTVPCKLGGPHSGEGCVLRGSCIPRSGSLFGAKHPLPRARAGEPADGALREYGLFRRPRQPRDEPPPAGLVGGRLDRTLGKDFRLSSYYPDYVRQLSLGRGYFAVPASARREALPPVRCWVSRQARQEASRLQRRRLADPVYCLVRDGAGVPAQASGCESFAAIAEGGRLFESTPFSEEALVELVPDGVDAVRIVYRAGPTQVVPVRENAYSFKPSGPSPQLRGEAERLVETDQDDPDWHRLEARYERNVELAQPIRVEWMTRGGERLRTIGPPPPGTRGGSTYVVGITQGPIGG